MVDNILEEWKELSPGSQDSEVPVQASPVNMGSVSFSCVCVAVSVYELENCNIIWLQPGLSSCVQGLFRVPEKQKSKTESPCCYAAYILMRKTHSKHDNKVFSMLVRCGKEKN